MSTVFRVGVQAGEGIVARLGTAVIVADASSGLETFTNVILAELDSAAVSAEDVAWRIAELLVANRASAPSFGVIIGREDGYQVLLHGNARALVNDDTELLGAGALTWVDRPIHEPVATIAVTLSSSGVVLADPRTDLRGGLVPGGGFVLSPTNAATPTPAAPEPMPASEPTPIPEPMPTPEPAPEPVPTPAWQPPPLPEPQPEPAVDQTLNLPAMESFRPQAREAVAISYLVAEDGRQLPLDRTYVFGREPHQDPLVASGSASPVGLDDPEQLISRVQAYLYVDASGVTIRDAKSANGTFIAAPGAPDWTRLGEQPAQLPVGWSLRLGRRVFTHHVPPGR